MNLGVKLGIDPTVLARIINTSSGRCWSSDTYNPVPGVMPNVPASRNYTGISSRMMGLRIYVGFICCLVFDSGGFAVDLMKKDLGLATEAAKAAGASLPLGNQTYELYSKYVGG